MITFLAIIHILACLGLIGLVLIQDSKGGGVFTAQSGSNSVLGAGGATTLAQTMTKALGVIFAITCIVLSIVAARSQKSVVDGAVLPTVPAAAAAPATTPETTSTAAETTTSPNTEAPAANSGQ